VGKILVVDDEEDVRTFLKMHLEDNNHAVQCAKDGREGFELLKSFKPDLVILDIIMPLQSGMSLYSTMRKSKKFEKIPVIILSAVVRYREQFEEKYAGLPAPDAFMDKPYDRDKLLRLVDSLMQ